MNIYICSLLSKKNYKFLNSHLKSLNRLKIPGNYKFKIIFVINPKFNIARNLLKKFLNNIDYLILESIRENIPDSRNVFLKFIKNKNIRYAGFLDDDCIIDKNWLYNMINFIDKNNCDIVGGPQKHKIKNKIFRDYYNVLEPNRHHGELVSWVATNNCFFSKKVLSKSNILFDPKLSNIGGSDQLFFNKLNKKKFLIRWNKKSFITENFNFQRENRKWFLRRNLRYGYSGNLIDKIIYGKMSLLIILIKLFYLIICSLLLLIFPSRKNYIKASFFILRALGRFIALFKYKPKKYI
tara:strand:- start:629 stop:1513 length:885 start_codon:yes stop_codon:yes gene_type:complete